MNVDSISQIAPSIAPMERHAPADVGFDSLVKQLIQQTNANQVQADVALESLVAGKTDNVHDVVLSLSKAEMSFAFLLEVRNRVVDAYHDLMRMQV